MRDISGLLNFASSTVDWASSSAQESEDYLRLDRLSDYKSCYCTTTSEPNLISSSDTTLHCFTTAKTFPICFNIIPGSPATRPHTTEHFCPPLAFKF